MPGKACALLCLVVVLVGAACGQAPATGPGTPTPAKEVLDGAMLLQARCTRCHTLARVEGARLTPAEWEQTVRRMVEKGADLSETEISVLVAYLAERYR